MRTWPVATVFIWCALWAAEATAQELYVLDGAGVPVLVAEAPAAPGHAHPVLFVHGHNALSPTDEAPGFLSNWIDGHDNLPSFAQALNLPVNSSLNIEAYFVRFIDQTRSIVQDAAELRGVIDQISERHGPSARIVIIAYSKGTLSSRLALKSMVEQVDGLPAPNVDWRPVSEFIAIAPPNHGLRSPLALVTNSLSADEMNNGYGPPGPLTGACLPSGSAEAQGFIERLNGHSMADSHANAVPLGSHPSEAPGSRAPGSDPHSGVLYVTLYASGNRDFVGGDAPPGSPANTVDDDPDCEQFGRVLARNLASDAINLSLAGIPGEDAVAVHVNTVHSGGVICRALHTAVHHAPPTGGECQVAATSIPEIQPAQRVAVELVLDYSGSMQQPACVDCAPKSQVLATAASLFVDLWQVVAAPGDRIGVTTFRSDASHMRCVVGEPCISVTGNEGTLDELLVPVRDSVAEVHAFIATQSAEGGTALGAGLRASIERLQSFDGVRKRVIVLTDGMQNVPPNVITQPPNCTDGDCPLAINGDSVMPLDASLGIAIDTIGVGVGDAWLGLLNDLSLATGGVSRVTMTPDDDLAAFFTDNIVDTLQGFSPQRVVRHRGALTETPVTHRFSINAGVRRVMLTLRGDASVQVLRDDVDLTPEGRLISREGYQLWTLPLKSEPAAAWTMVLKGKTGASYDAAVLVDEPQLEFRIAAGQRHYTLGESLALVANVSVNDTPVEVPVDVNVTVWRPGEAAANVLAAQDLFDPNKAALIEPAGTLAQDNFSRLLQIGSLRERLLPTAQTLPMTQDGPGRYRGESAPLTVPGNYRLEFTVSGEHPRLGRFQRSRTMSVAVSVGAANAKVSSLTAKRESGSGGALRWAVYVTPRDASGNHLGPGFSPRVRAALDAKAQSVAEDLGDGAYRIELTPSASPEQAIKIDIGADTLFAGKLADIVPPPELAPRDPWQYGIALALVLMVILWFRRALRPNASRNGRRR